MELIKLCRDAVVERHQLTEKVSGLTAETDRSSDAFYVDRAKFDERLFKAHDKVDCETRAKKAVKKEFAELKAMLAEVGPTKTPVLAKARLYVSRTGSRSELLSVVEAELV